MFSRRFESCRVRGRSPRIPVAQLVEHHGVSCPLQLYIKGFPVLCRIVPARHRRGPAFGRLSLAPQ